ncbi:tetratricopeptide repeat protein [Paenibacillus sp. GYB003]|uniref:tetratricopeptide repeat protein n=1 Tax=Paenibacillus sp. GYB003 TaxID=2994392 RepID=UPI002F96AD98
MFNDTSERERKFHELSARLTKSPLYKQKLSEYDLTGAALDRIAQLPLTTKADLRKAGAFGHLAVEMKQVAQYHESFGTTGEPSASWFTTDDLETGGRQMGACGARLTPDDLVLIRFPYAMSVPAFLMQHACRQAGAGVVPASGRNTVTPYPRVLDLMKRLGVTVIAGLPREMELLAETARLLGSDASADFPALRAICVAGELLGDVRRKHIERLWGVPVFNMYGSTETANIAAMCEHGVLHIAEPDFVVEVLKEDGSGHASPGERGFAAITTLSHQASPLLRYFNEDVISVEPVSCACGRTGSKLIHYGRLKDRTRFGEIVLDGKDVQDAVYSLAPVPDAWKAIQQESGFHIILDSHRGAEWSEEGIQTELSGLLKVPVTVEIAEGALLDRDELARNAPSRKPVYIQKRETEGPEPGSAVLLQDLLGQGYRLFKNGKYDRAKELFEEAARLDPRSAEAHAWLAASYGRQIQAVWSMMDKIQLLPMLESEIEAALEIDPALPLARRMNGARLLNTPDMLGGDPAAAIDEFLYCIGQGMDEAEVWIALAECYMKTDEPTKAIEALNEALSREPQNEEANNLMQQAAAKGDT